jgi:hypothetical protein
MPVETAKIEGRRKLNYRSLAELVTDADKVTSGPFKTLGNWSAGQIFRHLTIVMNGSMDGLKATFPWHLRLMARVFKKKLLSGEMPAGFKLPPEAAESMVPGPTSTEEGLAELHAAVARLEREPQRARHPAFGELSREQWDQLHLRHASMHMSFLVPQDS